MLSLWFYGLVDTAYNLLSQLNFPSLTRLSEVFCQVEIADKLPVKNKNNEWVTALILEEDNLTVAFYDFQISVRTVTVIFEICQNQRRLLYFSFLSPQNSQLSGQKWKKRVC